MQCCQTGFVIGRAPTSFVVREKKTEIPSFPHPSRPFLLLAAQDQTLLRSSEPVFALLDPPQTGLVGKTTAYLFVPRVVTLQAPCKEWVTIRLALSTLSIFIDAPATANVNGIHKTTTLRNRATMDEEHKLKLSPSNCSGCACNPGPEVHLQLRQLASTERDFLG